MKEEIEAHEITCDECSKPIGIFAKGAKTPECSTCGDDLCAEHTCELLINEGTPAQVRTILCREHFNLLLSEFARVLCATVDEKTNMIKISFMSRSIMEVDELAKLTAERGFDMGP